MIMVKGASDNARRVLVLGGTTEAVRLAERLAAVPGVRAVLSLAGRTRTPAAQAVETRTGGFGGIEGLREWLRNRAIRRVVDATHPFAAQMSAHAAEACAAEGIPRARFTRPPWRPVEGDLWTTVSNAAEAVTALGTARKRVFLPMGRLSLAPFAAAPWHSYLVRSIDPPGDIAFLPDHQVITGRPPFSRDSEGALLRDAMIEIVVTKNSGGSATYAKIEAARDLRLPVVVIAQPPLPHGPVFHDLEAALAFVTGTD